MTLCSVLRRSTMRRSLCAAGFAASLLIAISAWGVGSVYAQTTPVELSLISESKIITVGDPFIITLSATYPSDYHVIFPQVESEWGELEVRGQVSTPTANNGDGTLTSSIEIEAVLFSTGEIPTPALSVAIRRPDGTIINRPAPPIDLTVSSVLPDNDAELKDIKPQAELPIPLDLLWVARDGNGLVILTAASGVGLAVLAIYLWRRRLIPAAAVPGSPAEIALSNLDRIASMDPVSPEDFKECYKLVSDCLRTYLRDQFGVRAPELTTGQTLQSLELSDISGSAIGSLSGILGECDLVKFARLLPDTDDAGELISRSKGFVRETGIVPTVERGAVAAGAETA